MTAPLTYRSGYWECCVSITRCYTITGSRMEALCGDVRLTVHKEEPHLCLHEEHSPTKPAASNTPCPIIHLFALLIIAVKMGRNDAAKNRIESVSFTRTV
jgi:hypothetical protein